MENNPILNKFYWSYLIGLFIILALPILEFPPYFFPPDWGKTIVFKIVFSIILFIFFYQILRQKNSPIFSSVKKISKKNISFWLLILLFIVYFSATVFSKDIRFSLWGSPYRSGGFVNYGFYILLAAILFLIVKEKDWQKLWDFSIFTGFLVSLVALISYFRLFSNIFIPQKDALTSTIGGPTILGLYILILIFPTLSFAIKEQNIIKKFFYFLVFFLFDWIIFLTISQGAYLGLAVGLAYFLLFYPKKYLRLKLAIIVLMVAGTAAIIFIKNQPSNPINSNYLFSKVSNWQVDQSRLSAWKVSAKAFLNRPILGYGPENFSIGFDKYYDPSYPNIQRDPHTSGSWWDRPHNFILNILSDSGILGLLSFALLFIFLFFQLNKLKYSENPVSKIIPHGLQAALIAYASDSFFNFDSFSSFLILFLLVGYSLSLTISSENATEEIKNVVNNNSKVKSLFFKNKSGVIVILFLLLIYFIWFLNIKPLIANAEINKAQYYSDNRKCDQALTTMDKMLPQHTLIDGYVRLKYIDFLKNCSQFNMRNNLSYAKRGVELLKENIKIMPHYTRNWLMLGAFENVLISAEQNPDNKKALIEEAEGYFKKAFELSPKRQEVFIEWIKKDLVSIDYQKALEKSDICINLNPAIPDCYWFKGVVEIYFNNISDAKKYLQMAVDKGFDSNDVTSLNQLANAYAFSKNYKELALVYQKLTVIRSDVPQYHSSLAFTYRALGQYQKAKEEALKFLNLMPEAKDEVKAFLKTLP